MRLFTIDDGVFQFEGIAALGLALFSMLCGLVGAFVPASEATLWLALGVVIAIGQFPASGFDGGHYDPMQDDTRPMAIRLVKWIQFLTSMGVLVIVAVVRGQHSSDAPMLWPWVLVVDLAILAAVLLVAHRTSGVAPLLRGD